MRCASLYFILLSQIIFQHAFAQQYFFTNYSVDDGLSNNSVIRVIKDKDGYIWAGTYAGLNRFNGYDFTVYKSLAGDSTTLSSNQVHHFLTDEKGGLWIGTAQGICMYNKNKNNFTRIPVLTANGERNFYFETFQLFEDSKKNIWATVAYHNLIRFNPKRNCFEEPLHDLPVFKENGAGSIIEDADGTFWVMSFRELVHYNPADRSYKIFENKFPDGEPFQGIHLFPDSSDPGFLWIASWGSGLVHFDKRSKTFTSYNFEKSISKNLYNIVFKIHQQAPGKLWLGTNAGIAVFNSEKKIYEGFVRDSINDKPIVNTQINDIYRDDEGITWIGTVGGLSNIHPAKQNFVNEPLWLKAPYQKFYPVQKYYYDLPEDKFYGIRFYSNRALVIYERKLNRQIEYKIPHADELRAEPFSVLKDNHGLIWIGTTKGIYTFDEKEKRFSLFEIEKQLNIPNRALYINNGMKDSDGNLWFSVYSKGIIMVEPGTKKITTYFHDDKNQNSFPLFAPIAIAEGKGKSIYTCDEKHGIAITDRIKNTTKYLNSDNKKYASLKDATDMGIDRQNRIWVTTKNNGLVCIDDGRNVLNYIKDDFGNIIDEQQSIAIDDSGKIWFPTSNGIYRFDPESRYFTQFTVQDGFPARVLTTPLSRMNNGKISFLVTNGIFCFDPLKIFKADKTLNVHFTSFSVNGRVSPQSNFIDRVDTIRLNHLENNLTFEFAAINFTDPSSTLYSYMLEGVDHNWSVPSRTKVVNFSNLSPGNFWLRIKAGDYSPEKKIFIRIVHAWWQTTLFRWSAIIVIIAVSFFIIRYFLSLRYRQKIEQLERQREIENIRARISRDIHDEIGSGLTKIKLMSRNLSKAKEESVTKETSAKISTASDELIKNLGEIVWTINPANDTLENIFAFVRNYISKLFEENTEIKLKLDFTEPEKIPQGVIINPETKRNLLLILKESLTNIFKHSQATEVIVSMHGDKSEIRLNIRDNGKGITTENQNRFGNGINNMRKRSEFVNAIFTFESNGNGTAIRVSIPLSAERKIPT
ncbi:MAG TPA: two-component regulator propeller domain-containing protein [Bacteroidia bacterium]|nr:two-component regulator propeller domain-containing protein [Bacteroidia bacterium]